MNSVRSAFELYYKYQSLFMKQILLFVIGWCLIFSTDINNRSTHRSPHRLTDITLSLFHISSHPYNGDICEVNSDENILLHVLLKH